MTSPAYPDFIHFIHANFVGQLAMEIINGDLLLAQSSVASSHIELQVVWTNVYVYIAAVEISQFLKTDDSFLTAEVIEKGEKNGFYLIDLG